MTARRLSTLLAAVLLLVATGCSAEVRRRGEDLGRTSLAERLEDRYERAISEG